MLTAGHVTEESLEFDRLMRKHLHKMKPSTPKTSHKRKEKPTPSSHRKKAVKVEHESTQPVINEMESSMVEENMSSPASPTVVGKRTRVVKQEDDGSFSPRKPQPLQKRPRRNEIMNLLEDITAEAKLPSNSTKRVTRGSVVKPEPVEESDA